jgi:hypothetical protein
MGAIFNNPYRIVFSNVVIQPFWKPRDRLAVITLNESL